MGRVGFTGVDSMASHSQIGRAGAPAAGWPFAGRMTDGRGHSRGSGCWRTPAPARPIGLNSGAKFSQKVCISVSIAMLSVCIFTHMNSRDVIRAIEADGWYEVAQKGSHKQFKHPTKPGRVTVVYPSKDIPKGTLRSIEKQAGIKLR